MRLEELISMKELLLENYYDFTGDRSAAQQVDPELLVSLYGKMSLIVPIANQMEKDADSLKIQSIRKMPLEAFFSTIDIYLGRSFDEL